MHVSVLKLVLLHLNHHINIVMVVELLNVFQVASCSSVCHCLKLRLSVTSQNGVNRQIDAQGPSVSPAGITTTKSWTSNSISRRTNLDQKSEQKAFTSFPE